MEEVTDASGRRYVLLKQSSDASLLLDPATGDRRYRRNEELQPVDGGGGNPKEHLRSIIAAQEPVSVRTLLDSTSLCESDLHGILWELKAGGSIQETDVGGERGYVTT